MADGTDASAVGPTLGRGPGGRPAGPACAYVFEGGGRVASALEHDLRRLRHAVALDMLEALVQLRGKGDLDRVVLVTDRSDLADQAPPGVEVVDSAPGGPLAPDGAFRFGEALAALLARDGTGLALVAGGAAVPLCGPEDLRRFCVLARDNPGAVVQNNPQSPDVLAFSPAAAAATLRLPDSDNALGQALAGAGFRRVLIENSARVNFDLDTPADAAVLAGEAGAGPRTRRACADLAWIEPLARRLSAAESVLAGEGAELALFGRVGPPVTAYINTHLRCRLRVFSEERGMRALGRVASGQVVSFLGRLLDEVGPKRFFDLLGGCAGAALFDTRVLMAHWREQCSDADRFHADIGAVEAIADPRLAALAAAAWESQVPVAMGGHTLIYGGLWLLADRVVRRLRPQAS